MPLSPEKIAELVKKRDAPRAPRAGTGRSRKKFDPNDRTYQAWFALEHRIYDRETGNPAFCENPNCADPRDKTYGQTVALFGDKKLCRFCFISGWLATNPEQLKLD